MSKITKNTWRKDTCQCGFSRFLMLTKGMSIFHSYKCPKCKRVFYTKYMKIPEGSIMVNEEMGI